MAESTEYSIWLRVQSTVTMAESTEYSISSESIVSIVRVQYLWLRVQSTVSIVKVQYLWLGFQPCLSITHP